MFVASKSNPSQAPKVIELLVCLQPDDPTGCRSQGILNPSLSCLSGFSTVNQGGAREESMPEKEVTVLHYRVRSAILCQRQSQLSSSIVSEGFDGNIFAACCVVSWSNFFMI